MKKIIIIIGVLVGFGGVLFFVLTSQNNHEIKKEVVLTPTMVEQYVRENIADLVPEDPVLGGSWYVVSLQINEVTKTGVVDYEDGHIAGRATFSYGQDDGAVVIGDMVKIPENE